MYPWNRMKKRQLISRGACRGTLSTGRNSLRDTQSHPSVLGLRSPEAALLGTSEHPRTPRVPQSLLEPLDL